MQTEAQTDAFIGIRRVCEISGFSKSTILRKIQAGQAPAPIIQEGNVTRWSLAEWQAWQQARVQERAARQRLNSPQSIAHPA